ncbi:MAG: extracellular solute-binding protein [Acholeplasmatales bacterium]|nr:extracellular solute-binding protein [Acholeplasmatales bacterium]
MKKPLIFIAISILTLGLFSCTKEKTGFTPKYDVNQAYEVNVVGHYENFEAIEDEFVRFNKYYPNAKLTYTYLDNYNKIITTALNSESAPDIFFTFPWMINDSSYSDLFNFTEDFSANPGDIDISVIREGLLSKKGSEIPMLPIYVTTYGMMVNEDLFNKENISIPKTYNELVNACQSFKDKNYANIMMGHTSQILYPMFFPHFCSKIKDNKTAINELNELKADAGIYLKDSLELVDDFMSHDFINLDECAKLKNDYDAVIKRFFEGDIPMMLASGQTVSGTEKREKQSEAFTNNPFKYSLRPIPSTNSGGIFLNSVNLCFAVNKKSKNLEMTNEFMRFLINDEQLDNMSKIKRLMTPAKDMSLDNIYASFSAAEAIYISNLGLNDAADQKVRTAGSRVAQGKMSVEDAINNWNTIE